MVKNRPIIIGMDTQRLESRFTIRKYIKPKTWKPREISWLTVFEDHQIVEKYNQFMIGLGNYYCGEVSNLYKINKWHYILYYSCIKP